MNLPCFLFLQTNIAEAGTVSCALVKVPKLIYIYIISSQLTLEWATLSKYTGNITYKNLAENSVRHIATAGAPLPGLPAQGLDPSNGKPVGGYVVSFCDFLLVISSTNFVSSPFLRHGEAARIVTSNI